MNEKIITFQSTSFPGKGITLIKRANKFFFSDEIAAAIGLSTVQNGFDTIEKVNELFNDTFVHNEGYLR